MNFLTQTASCRGFFLSLLLAAPPLYSADITFSRLPANLPSPFIKDIAASGDSLFVATANGLAQVSARNGSVTRVYNRSSGLPDNYITTVAISPDGKTLWVGTSAGLARLDISSGNSTIFNRRQKQLSDDRVSAIYVDENYLFVGTSLGVDRYDFAQNKWTAYTAIEGLAGGNIMAFAAEGDILWAAGAEGLSYYDRNDDFWESYGVANGLNSNLLTSLVLDYDAVWVGTAGGGISRFDRNALRFEAFTSDIGLADDNVQALIDDGAALWIATFDGLSRLEKATLRFFNYNARNGFNETSMTSGAIIGNKIFIGTDGGIYSANKQIPQVSFSYRRTGYSGKKEISVYASITSEDGIAATDLLYKPADAMKDEWFRAGVTVTGKSGSETEVGRINVSQLAEGKYIARIEAKSKNGMTNRSHGLFIVDHTPPRVDLMFRAPRPDERETMVTGRYEEQNLASLEIDIGGKKTIPTIDRQQKRFRFPYTIGSAAKIKITATDIAGNRSEIVREYIVDNDPPVVTVEPVDGTTLTSNLITIQGTVQDKNIDQVIVNPGQIPATLSPIGADLYEYRAQSSIKKEGIFTFQITAFDKGGRTATVSLPVKFFSDVSIIEVADEKIPAFTLKSEVEFSGNILGPLLKEFYIDPGKKTIPVKADKSFSLKLPLKPGKNKFTMVAVHDRTGEQVTQDFEIEYSDREATARLSEESRSFTQKLVTIRGTYDKGISRILVNRKNALLNPTNNEYSAEIELKDGANTLKITAVDEIGRVKERTETVYLDREAPVLFVRRLPEQTGLERLRFRGRIEDISPYKIEVFPGGAIDFAGGENGAFEGVLHLKKGINRILFTATDAAGNRTRREFLVEHDPSYPMREEAEGATNDEELLALRREIEELKKRTVRSGAPVTTLAASRLPAKPGLYLVPVLGKMHNYDLTAKLYLGSETFSPILASFNGQQAGKQVLVPNPDLFRLINSSRNRAVFDNVIRQSGRAYMQNRQQNHVEKEVLKYLARNRQLKNVRERSEYTVFEIRSGAGVIIAATLPDSNRIRQEGLSEILIASVGARGISFTRY